ncbi:MAG: nucleotidyl transferase AbiEii/AbiGii toxin family protein [Actinomycetota bacterium]
MIERRALERRAGALGITVRHVQLDYVLHHLLAGFAGDDEGLVFRGGTALARVYWPDFRISEDLDFIAPDRIPDFERRVRRVVAVAADTTGLDARVEIGGWRDDRLRATVSWTGWDQQGELLIDVVRGQRPALPPEKLPLDLRYPDLEAAVARRIRVLQLDEILANKWLMLDDREEPRDLFDLWWGLTRGRVPFEAIAAAHLVAYRYPPMTANIERAIRLKDRWEQRLAYQLNDLAPFDAALAEVRRHFDTWRSSTEESPGTSPKANQQ